MATLRLKVDKLIRDRIPEALAQENITVAKRIMDDREWISRLKDKLIEEAKEIADAKDLKEFKEELADMMEVFSTLLNACGIAEEEIKATAALKKLTKGGFEKKVYSPYLEIACNHPKISYYQARSDRYPIMGESP